MGNTSLRAYFGAVLAATLVCGCAYTRLDRPVPSRTESTRLPDLAIASLSTSVQQTRFADGPDEIQARIQVRVINFGHAPFHGTLFLGWIDRPPVMERKELNYVGPYQPCTLAPGDSVDLARIFYYPIDQPTTEVKVIVLTDQRMMQPDDASIYNCGSSPVMEERYDNNEFITTVYPDSVGPG